jgi:DNA polymerase-3 subunit alpha
LLSREIADFTRGESDNLRKAMGKKLIDKLNQMYPKFLKGGESHGYDPKILEKIWEDWRAFASYAFNKSHATCYSWVAYQTAYIKANYPSHYMAGYMSRSLDNITEITKAMNECKAMGINVYGPDINESKLKFSVNFVGDVRFGLGAIKGVGEGAVENILDERKKNGPFTSIYDFVERINLSTCNKKCLESMVLAGAFDSFEYRREQYFEVASDGDVFIDSLIKYGTRYQVDQQAQQNSLFGGFEELDVVKPKASKTYKTWSDIERLNKERDLIGIYISAHPLDSYQIVLNNLCTTTLEQLQDKADWVNQDIYFGGIVNVISREGQTKNGSPFGIVVLEDYSGTGELALFGDDWARYKGYFNVGNPLFISARVEPHRFRPNEYDLKIGKIEFLSEIKEKKIEKITINVALEQLSEDVVEELIAQIESSPGNTALYLNIRDIENNCTIPLISRAHALNVTKQFVDFIQSNSMFSYTIN